MRARAMAIWAAAFVGVLPIGALITGGLAAWLGAGGAVAVDGLLMLVGGARARAAARGGLARLRRAPEACSPGLDPVAVAVRESGVHAALRRRDEIGVG